MILFIVAIATYVVVAWAVTAIFRIKGDKPEDAIFIGFCWPAVLIGCMWILISSIPILLTDFVFADKEKDDG